MTNPLPIASNSDGQLCLLPQLANRHGCITGATGTGKTVTLQVLAQALSDIGVPVFMADVKGDLSGLGKAGAASPKVKERLAHLGLAEPAWAAAPVAFWDVYGEKGHPVRATISDMGPLMLARMLNLNDTQQGVLQLVFKIADDNGLLLLDTKDLRAMLQHVGEHAAEFKTEYGNISAASIGAIQRGLIAIDEQGGDKFFGEPMLNIEDWMQTDARGKGVINILSADKLMNAPRLYSTFLLWMLSELFEHLPEVGDLDKPKMAFFFDEAHLLFDEAPKPLLQKIEQVVRLIRSKGVGVYFVTQNPLDIPDTVLGQLGNRVQHALRAYTPRDQKAVTAAAETFRANPRLNTAQAITELGVGEALVSFLDEKGRPNVVERGYVLTPPSQIGPVSEDERRALMAASLVAGIYEQAIDRESAYERLKGRTVQQQPPAPAQTQGTSQTPADDNAWGASAGRAQTPPAQGARPSGGMARPAPQPPQSQPQPQPQDQGGGLGDLLKDAAGGIFGNGGSRRRSDSPLQAMVKSAARSIGSQVGREIIRGVLGSLMKKR
ncbi:helicase HerA-like C-terminal domain-containing protein [Herbaspirillum robiniae]|uniref:ATP-binding protein n=1 Tax=Herbaspirillum robiniae TaxID=2014887 RepID=A0A246WRB4_9BURK|nr:helicase HerA-like C-terminal domain-containing protein [Herbaspirillum robiniae]OWY28924.1 ATP-binding protein [Herbaspirillum robiniae]